jgi:hypothetical protein
MIYFGHSLGRNFWTHYDPRFFLFPRSIRMSASASSASPAPAFPTRFDLEVVPPASRNPFSVRETYNMRLVRPNEPVRFIPIKEISRKLTKQCKILADLYALDQTYYLAEFGGMPGLVKSVNTFAASGILIVNPDQTAFTSLCESRVDGNRIKFGYGSKQKIEERCECWELAIQLELIEVVTEVRRAEPISYPLTLLREENNCPVCFDDLSGNVVACENNHQTCLACWNLLNGNFKKCPACRGHYPDAEIERACDMNGREAEAKPYFKISLTAGNSWKEYTHNEALFFSMIKKFAQHERISAPKIDCMILSALYNYYMDEDRKFSSYNYNILYQADYNNRTYKPYSDDLTPVILDFIDNIRNKEIYDDVAYTQHYIGENEYSETEFNSQLDTMYGFRAWEKNKEYPGDKKKILKREIYWRYWIENRSDDEIKDYIKKLFQKIISCKSEGSVAIFRQTKKFIMN